MRENEKVKDILNRVINVIKTTNDDFVGWSEKRCILLRLEEEFYDDLQSNGENVKEI